MTAKEHAQRASFLLYSYQRDEEHLAQMSEDERTHWEVRGGPSAYRVTQEARVQLAQAHAMTALALSHTGDDPE